MYEMSATSKHRCSNCRRHMRVLTLAGHYQRAVEVDVCDACCLIWFDGMESVRLAGPGVADMVRTIHAAMSGGHPHPEAASLAHVQSCPVCQSRLAPVRNVSRFGRTSQHECPQGHGYYQTYILYLAEKGFIRPMEWGDMDALAASTGELFCASCGAGLELRPHDACPHCHSAMGVLDAARLASAIDIHGSAAGMELPGAAVSHEQTRCADCGAAVDSTRDAHCPQCHALVRRKDTAAALDASVAVEAAVRQNYESQLPHVSDAKLRALQAASAYLLADDERHAARWSAFKARAVGACVVFVVLMVLYLNYRDAGSGQPPHYPGEDAELAAEEK